MITDANGMPVLQPLVDDASTATFNAAFAQIGTGGQTAQPGDIKFSARATAPSGWLIANGAVVSRTTYATLFAAIGTAFGAGNGSTTFGLPDLRGRVPVGVKSGDADFGTLGATPGAISHSHSGGGMRATAVVSGGSGGLLAKQSAGSTSWTAGTRLTASVVASTESTTFGLELVGDTAAGHNLQPSLALTPLIKI